MPEMDESCGKKITENIITNRKKNDGEQEK